jgi:hypothetical protein
MTEIETSIAHQVSHVFARAPHLWDPSGTVAAWFTEPPGAWIQFVTPARCTDDLSEWLAGPALEALVQRFPGQMLTVVCDYRLMSDRDLSARARMLQTAPGLQRLLTKVVMLPSLTASATQRETLTAGARLLRSFGIPVEIETSAPLVLHQLGLRASV